MIKRLLIANRGEIALRIIKSCKKLNIETISVCSQAEIGHPHLLYADINITCDKETPSEVYLDPKLLIEIALKHHADAIHPGYGFLSEQAHFAAEVNKAGLIFIGPSAETLNALGDKAQTRQLAIALGVPVTPGYQGKDQDEKTLLKEAEKIGFPVLLKAVMGGGGRGMRKVKNSSEFIKELKSAQQEALRLYNNCDICIEKFIENPRHIEVQVAGDQSGNYIHLFERDCSIQRRFQKIVEFSPAFNINKKILSKLYESALSVAKGAKLHGLATMEFLVSEKDYYFLEANPRIQVEHPVTELVTDIDLIELQIKIANKESIKNIKPKLNGSAAEVRIYAEIPELDYLPSYGRIRSLNLPNFDNSFQLQNSQRYDHALFTGFTVNQHFDPMLAKIILSSKEIQELRVTTLEALNKLYIQGIETNLPLLIALFYDKEVFNFTSAELENKRKQVDNRQNAAIANYLQTLLIQTQSPYQRNWRNNGLLNESPRKYYVENTTQEHEDRCAFEIKFSEQKHNEFKLRVNGHDVKIAANLISKNQLNLKINNKSHTAIFHNSTNSELAPKEIQIDGRTYLVSKIIKSNSSAQASKELLLSPLPGKVTKVHVTLGQKMNPGDILISIESMKIEHNLKLAHGYKTNTVIEKIFVEEGSNINANQELLKFNSKD